MSGKIDRSSPGNGASIPQLPSRSYDFPALKLNLETLRYDQNMDLVGELIAGFGKLVVEIRDGFVHCRGDRDELIRNGILKTEWLPGMPGNGRFSHSVMLNAAPEQGNEITGAPVRHYRIYIAVWSRSPNILEARLPLTAEMAQEIKRWKAQGLNRQSLEAKATKSRGRKQGNVIHLFPS